MKIICILNKLYLYLWKQLKFKAMTRAELEEEIKNLHEIIKDKNKIIKSWIKFINNLDEKTGIISEKRKNGELNELLKNI